MNALLRIQVQVAAREAQASLRSLTTTINQVNRASTTVGRGAGGASSLATGAKSANRELTALGRLSQKINGDIDRSRMGMIQLGKNMQWVGRQINFNFTIPLLLAGRASMSWALENERAFTRVRKVYGESGKDYTAELGKVSTAIRMLSDYYGVNISQVTELAAQWAAAGATGAALAESVKNSLDLSILGDYQDLGDIFKQLITIQTAYKFNAGELKTAIAALNTTENMTAATLPDLVTGIAKAGSSAELAGVDFQHLAAFMAVLTPATGSAANAGNSLKTIFSRLAKPTKDVIDALKDMGIEFGSASFQALNGSQKLELMASKFEGLSDAQKAWVASSVGARFQVNKFAEIMDSITDKAGTYQNVLKAITGEGADTRNLAAANREIQTLLQSDPRKIQILTNSIKNLLIDAITPAIPVIATILGYVQALFKWFGNLSPTIQKLAIGFLILVASVGVAAQMIGSFKLLFGTAIDFFIWAATLIPGIGLATEAAAATTTAAVVAAEAEMAAATTTGGAAIGAGIYIGLAAGLAIVGVIIWKYHKQITDAIGKAVEFVKRGFNSLPQSIQNALLAVARVVATIIRTIVHWLSYLNPFARHSPSLVDNVTAGVEAILAQYARLSNVGAIFANAARDLMSFTQATAAAVAAAKAADRAEQRKSIVATSPTAGPSVDQMFGNLDDLNSLLGPLNAAIAAQQTKVDSLKASYDLASAAVDHFEFTLKPLQDLVASLGQQIDDSKQKISDFANTNITGMKASSDAIFANTMAQKKLRLEILQLGDAQQGYEDIRKQIDLLNGDIESIRGTMTSLQQSGAGSDVLSVYQQQMDELNAQKAGLDQAAANGQDLTKQLEDLQHQAEILDLQNSLNFDPLLRQIDDLANGIKELPFDEIVAGITNEKANLDRLTAAYDANKASLDSQQAVLDTMMASRDALKQSYDDENAILGILKDKYSAIEDQIRAITDALNEAVAATKTLTPSGGGGGGGGGGVPFEDLTGEFDPTTLSGDLGSMQETIDQWIADMKKQFDGIDLNPFNFIKKGWHKIEDWWNATAFPWVSNLGTQITEAFSGIGENIAEFFSNLKIPAIGNIGEFLGEFFLKLPGSIDGAWNSIQEFWDKVGPAFAQFGDLVQPAIEAFGHVFNFIKMIMPGILKVIQIFFYPLKIIWDTGWKILTNVLGPIWNGITNTITNFLNIIHGVITVILSVINGDWGKAWDGIKQIFFGIWDEIWNRLTTIWAIIEGFFGGIIETITNIGSDIINGFWQGLQSIWDSVIGWISDVINGFVNTIKDFFGISSPSTLMMDLGIDIITGLFNGLVDAAVAVWNWFVNLGPTILGYFLTAGTWLWQKGKDIVGGILGGIGEAASNIWNWFTELPGKLLGYFLTAFTWLWDSGKDIAMGIVNGIIEQAVDIWAWFTSLPGAILGYFLSAGTWLWDVGKKIIQGLWDGMKSVWSNVTGWLGGLGSSIIDLKGPPSRDAKLLQNNGLLIMRGLKTGMQQGWNEVSGWLNTLDPASLLSSNMPTLGVSLGTQAAQLAGAGATSNQQIIFNGDLSFPNITDPADADKFIQNLEVLASSHGGPSV